MDVFVIGGTGLISAGVVRQLVDAGHDVTALTRGESSTELPDGATSLRGDRHDTERLEAAVTDNDPDCLIDMVCFTPETAEETIDAVAQVDQYVLCSTVDVYHRPPEHNPVAEGADRYPNVSDYGRNKAAAEDAFWEAHERGDLAVTVLRPWSTYGEGGRVLHTFGDGTYYLSRLPEGNPIVVHGDGTSLWGACHRDDVARAFVGAVGNERASGEAYNVTSEEVITWNQYHRRVAGAIGAPEPELVHVPTDVLVAAAPDRTEMLRKHFQYSTVFDNTKARRDLGFEYTVALEDGIDRTVDWLEARDAIEPWESEPFDDAIVRAWREAAADIIDSADEFRQ
ncbi:NAD-dependent epimerase/dehydratase family protein [Natronorubrum sp. FCH18a]|uniref:NAD-dependent epimerase/dehydratase family protein n=1 Tax=Natronorubrum sp. FCH18a TaxID=3447018 RepID=UPI003F513CF2